MIDMEKLSCEEKKAIEELRRRMGNELTNKLSDDPTLFCRFLKARDFDVDKAEVMLRNTLSWRKHFQVDTILKDFTPRPFFEKFIKLSHLGMDKKGNTITYLPVGDLDAKEVMNCVQVNEYMKHWVWHFEEIAEDNKKLIDKTGKTILQSTMIMNLDKLTFANATYKLSVEVCARILRIMQDNYPEALCAIYFINAPAYYVFIFSVLKALMSRALIQKIHIYSYTGWKEKLLEAIDADVLPAFLGGNRTDPDGNPLCSTFVKHGGRIPKMYYLPEEERHFTDRSLVKRITVPSNEKKEIAIHVAETGLRIHWEFFLKSKDIGFGFFYKISNYELEEILPIVRYETSDGVEKGSYKSLLSGHYVIVFDNSYSWMNNKEVEYCIRLLKP